MARPRLPTRTSSGPFGVPTWCGAGVASRAPRAEVSVRLLWRSAYGHVRAPRSVLSSVSRVAHRTRAVATYGGLSLRPASYECPTIRLRGAICSRVLQLRGSEGRDSRERIPSCLSHASRGLRQAVCRVGCPVAVRPSRATFLAGRQCSPLTKVFGQCQAFTSAISVLAVASITRIRSAPATESSSRLRRDVRRWGASGVAGAPSLVRRQAHCARSPSRARRCSGPIGHGPLR